MESRNEQEAEDADETFEDSDYENDDTKSESGEEFRGKQPCPECNTLKILERFIMRLVRRQVRWTERKYSATLRKAVCGVPIVAVVAVVEVALLR